MNLHFYECYKWEEIRWLYGGTGAIRRAMAVNIVIFTVSIQNAAGRIRLSGRTMKNFIRRWIKKNSKAAVR
jgi:transposase